MSLSLSLLDSEVGLSVGTKANREKFNEEKTIVVNFPKFEQG